ncbi:hypothetical protein D3C79_900990 [compost metagenome]
MRMPAGRGAAARRMARQIVAAHQGVVGHHMAEQVVEFAEDEPAPALALLLIPGMGGLVPG